MSLDKAVKYKKENRKPFRKSKRFDKTCRCHGSCPWCERARTIFDKKWREKADEQLKEWKNEKL